MPQKKYVIGLIFVAGYEFSRKIVEGVSELSHQNPGVEIHILREDGRLPDPENIKHELDGVIAFNSTHDLERLRKLAPHMVCTSARDKPEGGDFVVNDDKEAGRMAADYFIRKGHRDLVYLGYNNLYHFQKRFEGFSKQAASAGIKVVQFDLFTDDDVNIIPEKLHQLPSRCGVFAANDHTARKLMISMEHPVSNIPLMYGVLGVDNDPMQRVLCPVPLSSVELNGKKIGYLALKRLIARIENPDLKDEITLVPPLQVITRQSTDLFALEDDLAAQALRMMDEKLSDIHDVGDLVDYMKTPRRTLELRFRNATGRTLARELAMLRVERARELLRNSDMDTEAVARKVGLPESRMLWLLFKRLTGETPSAYRKRMNLFVGS